MGRGGASEAGEGAMAARVPLGLAARRRAAAGASRPFTFTERAGALAEVEGAMRRAKAAYDEQHVVVERVLALFNYMRLGPQDRSSLVGKLNKVQDGPYVTAEQFRAAGKTGEAATDEVSATYTAKAASFGYGHMGPADARAASAPKPLEKVPSSTRINMRRASFAPPAEIDLTRTGLLHHPDALHVSRDLELPLRTVFAFYCSFGDPMNTSYMSLAKYVLLCRDVGIDHLLPTAELEILYTKAASADGITGKLVYGEFVLLLSMTSEALRPMPRFPADSQACFESFLRGRVLQRARRADKSQFQALEKKMVHPELWATVREYARPLELVFRFYSQMIPEGTRFQRAHFDAVMSLEEFYLLAHDFDLFPACVSKPAMQKLFSQANEGTVGDEDANQLDFVEFLEMLVRIALCVDLRGREPDSGTAEERYCDLPFSVPPSRRPRKGEAAAQSLDPARSTVFSSRESRASAAARTPREVQGAALVKSFWTDPSSPAAPSPREVLRSPRARGRVPRLDVSALSPKPRPPGGAEADPRLVGVQLLRLLDLSKLEGARTARVAREEALRPGAAPASARWGRERAGRSPMASRAAPGAATHRDERVVHTPRSSTAPHRLLGGDLVLPRARYLPLTPTSRPSTSYGGL